MPLIDEVYLWVATEPDGNEGIPAVTMNGTAYPLVSADTANSESFREVAQHLCNSGVPMKRIRLSTVEVLEVLIPESHPEKTLDPQAPSARVRE